MKIKEIKGFININKGKLTITSSVYNGEDTDTKIQENVIKGLENFGFTKSKKEPKGDWLNYLLFVDNLDEEVYEKISEIDFETHKRVKVLISVDDDKQYTIFTIKTIQKEDEDEEQILFALYEEEITPQTKIGQLWMYKGENNTSIMVTFSPMEDNKEEIEELVKLGFNINERDEYTKPDRVKVSKWFQTKLFSDLIIDKLENEEKHSVFGKIEYLVSNYNSINSFEDIVSLDEDGDNNPPEVDIDEDDVPF